MPILVYFKQPSISLVMKGHIDDDMLKQLSKLKGMKPIIQMVTPTGEPALIFPRADLDIAYMLEVTDEEYEKMKKMAEERRQQQGRITPAQFFAPSMPGKGGKGN